MSELTGEELARVRKRRLGMTQAELAERLGMGERTLREYEAGRAPVPRWLRYCLAALLVGLPPYPLDESVLAALREEARHMPDEPPHGRD